MEYRKATKNDSSDLIRLMEELGYSHTKESIAKNLEYVENSGGRVFLAVSKGAIVGCVCAIIDVRLAAGKCGEIVSLVVLSDCRGKGVGRELIA